MAKKAKDKDKTLRKELEAPDEFQIRASQGLEFLREKRRPLLWGGIGLGAVIAASLGYYYYYSSSRETAGLALTRATEIYAQPIEPAGVTPTPPPRPIKGKEIIPKFASEEEKLAAAHDEWKKVAAEYSGPAVAAARLGEAATLFDLGQYDQAEATYREFLAQAPRESASRVLAQEGLGYALEAKGDIEGAIEAFRQIFQNDPKGFYADVGRFHIARLYEKQGKTEEAIAEYKALLTELPPNPLSPVQESAKQHLRALGVEPPAQADPLGSLLP